MESTKITTKWSVTENFHGSGGLVEVDIREVLSLGVDSKTSTIVIQTRNATYYTSGTLRYWTHVLNSSGYHFLIADRNNSINISKIVMIDKYQKIAYFDLNDHSISCTMSKSGLGEVLGMLEETNTTVAFT